MIRGRHSPPGSLATWIEVPTCVTLVSKGRSNERRRRRSSVTRASASAFCTKPTLTPLTKQIVLDSRSFFDATRSGVTLIDMARRISSAIGVEYEPVRTCVMSARLLTRPQPVPSGDSDGHTTPYAVGCSCRGFGHLPSRAIGVLILRMLDCAERAVIRPTTWATPFCEVRPDLVAFQFPVAKQYLYPLVMRLSENCSANGCVSILPFSTRRCCATDMDLR